MDFSWTEEQLDYKQRVIDFARDELLLKVELDAAAPRGIVVPFPLHAWKQCADFAVVFAATNPEQGRWGILAFIVIERGTTGFEQSEALPIGQVWDETKGLV